MIRAKKSPEWREFIQKAISEGYEVITRIGDPVVLCKKDAPISPETVWWVFFQKGSGSWSKHQIRGMKLISALGLKLFRYGALKGEKTAPEDS